MRRSGVKKEYSTWKLIKEYGRARWKICLFICFLMGIFGLLCFLYNVTLEPILYGIIICSIVCICIAIIDFFNYRKRYQQLLRMRERVKHESMGLPQPKEAIEEQYQELLELLLEEKKEIVSNMDNKYSSLISYYTLWAHQIKTPIAAMYLLLQISKDFRKSEMEQELFKIECYVEMVLGYLRASASSSDFLFQRYDLGSLIKQAVKKYASVFIYSNIRLCMEEIHETVLTDEKWLVFVIEQILSNALKYTNSGGSVHIFMEAGEKKILVIEDSGIGIREEDLPRVFEEGYTGYNGHMDKRSTGIGLYLCKMVMTKIGHRIWIESAVNKGTRVMLDLTEREQVRQ